MEQTHSIRHYAGDCFTDPTFVFTNMKSEEAVVLLLEPFCVSSV